MTWQIWFAVAAIVLTIVGLVKRLETRMLLVVAGFCMCAVRANRSRPSNPS